jgi:hypothetical protein
MTRKTILLLTLLFQLTFVFGQSQLSTDTSVKVFPHWKKGETHSVSIKSSTDENSNGKTSKYLTTFGAKFLIVEKDSSGYTIEWSYTNVTLAPNEVTLENNILANLIDTKLLIKLSLVGRFKELINSDDIKVATDKVIDKLISGSENNPAMNVQYKAAKQMISTKQGLEIALLKQIKFYNLSFGFNYKLNHLQTNKVKFPNPLGGQPFDAVEIVSLSKLDNSKSICAIETTKNVDVTLLKNNVIEYLKKASNKDSKAIEDELRNDNIEFSENSMQQIDFSKGIIQKSSFKRKMNFGFQSRTNELEIETAD